jgi:4-amino-4-deoxy-L-arabinose transferase-like glycosyltransferase
MTGSQASNRKSRAFNWSLWALIAILLVAAFLRLYRLDKIPPGLTHDEADTGHFFAAVYHGARSPLQVPYGYGYEPLPMYTGALFMRLFGPTDLALRLHSVFFGLVLLVFTYLWASRAFSVPVGLGGAALIGVSFWTVCDSRFALNSQPAPALFTGASYFLWLALDDNEDNERWWAWALFALSLSGSLYVYEAARAAAVAFGLFFLYLAFFHRRRFSRHVAWFAGALILAGILAAPHLLDPGAWGRTSTLSGPLQATTRGDLRPLWRNIVSGLGTFSFRGDSLVTYNLPGRPIFDPVVSLFFYGGIGVCLWRWRKPAYAFVLMWLAMGMLPTLVLGAYTSTLHSKAAEPPIMVLPALCAVEVVRFLSARTRPSWATALTVGFVVWLGIVATSIGYDYFVRWGESPETRAAYFHNLAAITEYLNDTEYSGDITLSSPFPDLPLDPFIADMRVQRDDLVLHWCDARRSLVFPNSSPAILILPSNTPLDPYLTQRLDLQPVERVHLRPDDVDPYFDVFEWSPATTLRRFLAPSTQTVTARENPLDLPVRFGDAVELLAYDLPEPVVGAGEVVTLVTVWRILDLAALGPPPATEYGYAAVIFAHVLDASDDIIGQEDRLDAPAWNWRPGDAFVQIHRFQIRPDAPPGLHRLELGIYTRADGVRLSVMVDGIEQDHHVLLQSLEVRSQ